MTERQNPAYDDDQSRRDALALVAAIASNDERLVDDALSNALEMTSHTDLAHNLALMVWILLEQLAGLSAQPAEALLQQLAVIVEEVHQSSRPDSD